jgi:hypothetical protein
MLEPFDGLFLIQAWTFKALLICCYKWQNDSWVELHAYKGWNQH